MSGNVFEWCNDFKRGYTIEKELNPLGDSSGFFKVFERLNNTGSPFVFKQGMDFRLLTEKKMKVLCEEKGAIVLGTAVVDWSPASMRDDKIAAVVNSIASLFK